MIRTFHVFRCESADLYGVTRDQTGANLPADQCTGGWRFIRTVELGAGLPSRGMDVAWQDHDAVMRAAVASNGFFIGEAAALPGDFK